MLYYLIYYSTATNILRQNDLDSLLVESRIWNEKHELTGMLAYIEGRTDTDVEARFMQVLEGTREEVQFIFHRIARDKRHHHVTLLKEAELKTRNFSSWSMKFEKLNLQDHPELAEFFEIDRKALESDSFRNSDLALNFLKAF